MVETGQAPNTVAEEELMLLLCIVKQKKNYLAREERKKKDPPQGSWREGRRLWKRERCYEEEKSPEVMNECIVRDGEKGGCFNEEFALQS